MALTRDGHRCTVPGCGAPAAVVDHIRTRPYTSDPCPADRLSNLRSLCRTHDNQLKEGRTGTRARGGKPVVTGCDANWHPLDPAHPWNAPGAPGPRP